MPQSGARDRRITLQRGSSTPSDYGDPVTTWAPLATVWAQVTPVSDRERFAAAQTVAEITHRFAIRYGAAWADFSPADRLIYQGRVYDVAAVKEIGRREGLEITARARTDQ